MNAATPPRRTRAARFWPAIVFLYLGPPFYRAGVRSAEASLEGAVDVAILFRVAWWLFFGAVALLGIVRMRRHLVGFFRDHQLLHLLVVAYLVALGVSVLRSPALLFSAVNVGMMAVLVVAALDLGLRLRIGVMTVRDLLRDLNTASWTLLAVMGALLVVAPGVVASRGEGALRLLGGDIGDPTVLAGAAVVTGVHLALTSGGWARRLYALSLVPAFAALLLTRGRTVYVGIVLSLAIWFVLWLARTRPARAVRAVATVALVAGALCGAALVAQVASDGALLAAAGTYLVRDVDTVGNLSGRTGIFQVLLRAVPENPLGLGFMAGPRTLLLGSAGELLRYDVIAARIGNAHNAYLEMLAGTGFLGGFAFAALLIASLARLMTLRARDLAAAAALLALVIVHGFTGSDAALPFGQASALLWMMVGTALGMRARSVAPARARPAALWLVGLLALVPLGMAQPAGGVTNPDALAAAEVVLHVAVDQPGASDRNRGTSEAPLATLGEALARALVQRREGIATRVIVHPGTYRESLVGVYGGTSGSTITFEAAQPGTAVVSGADVFQEWTCTAGVCEHAWPYRWGEAENPWPNDVDIGPLALRSEIVFVDGANLEQVAERADLAPGSFFVDEANGRLVLAPPDGVDLASALVEVGVRPTLMRLQGLNDVVVRGLVFTGAASPFRQAALDVVDQERVTIEDVDVVWNGQGGLSLKGRELVVRNTRMNSNGSSGIAAYQVADVQVLDSEASFNNWRGVRGGYSSWDVGHKFSSAHRVLLRGFRAFANQARGLWLDADIVDVVVEDAYLCDNLRDGLFLEAIQGPVRVADSLICGNRAAGILTSASQNVEFLGNVVRDNHAGQLAVSGQLERRVVDWETGDEVVARSRNWLWFENLVVGADQQMLVTSTLPSRSWSDLMASSMLAGNMYVHPDLARPFEGASGSRLDFGGWRSESGEAPSSVFARSEEAVR